jgi:nucleolar GTP-binding protein
MTYKLQCKLFHSIKPLFANKPTVVVFNKIDVKRLDDLEPTARTLVDEIIDSTETPVTSVQVSCHSEEGVMHLKNVACDALLAHRVENKVRSSKLDAIANRIHVAMPKPRDDIVRAPFIPEAVLKRSKYDKDDPDRRKLLRDVEAEEGGPGVYNINLKGE